MTYSIDDTVSSGAGAASASEKELTQDQKDCYKLIKESVSNKSFWATEGTNTWSLSSDKSMTPTYVEMLQKATNMPNTVGELEKILNKVWKREKSEKKESNRSATTKDLYRAIDMMKGSNPDYAQIKQILQNVIDASQNVEVKKTPKMKGSSDDKF